VTTSATTSQTQTDTPEKSCNNGVIRVIASPLPGRRPWREPGSRRPARAPAVDDEFPIEDPPNAADRVHGLGRCRACQAVPKLRLYDRRRGHATFLHEPDRQCFADLEDAG
jgi:hypothetical protein